MKDNRRSLKIFIGIVLVLEIMLLGLGLPPAIKEFNRAKACTEPVTAELEPWDFNFGVSNREVDIKYTYKYTFNGHEYDSFVVLANYDALDPPEEITVLVDPEDPGSNVVQGEKYTDVGNGYTLAAGLVLLAALVIWLIGRALGPKPAETNSFDGIRRQI